MIVKTRSNFFLKFSNEKIMIRKKESQQNADMSKVEYEQLMNILTEFRDAKEVNLTERDSLYLKMFKFAVEANLICSPFLTKNGLSNFVVENMENRFDNYSEVLENLKEKSFAFKNCSTQVEEFFENNGLIDRSRVESLTVYGNDSIETAPIGSFCILEKSGRYLYFQKDSEESFVFYKRMLESFPEKEGKIGSWIHPLYSYIFLTNQLYSGNLQRYPGSILFEDGTIVNLPQGNRMNATVSNYERTFIPVKGEDEITKLRILESLFLSQSFLIKQINSIDSSRNNQLSVAQYQIDFIDNYRFIGTGTSFKKAAIQALTYSIGNFLNEQEGKNGTGVWISDIDKHLFYIRGVASLLEGNHKIYEVKQHPPDILKIIEEIKRIGQFSVIKVGIEYIFQHDVARIYLTNESDEVVYRSEITTDTVEALKSGLARIISDIANNELRFAGKVIFEKEKVSLEAQQKPIPEIFTEIMEVTKEMKISEKPWFYQPLFESFGLYIGKFQMEAR